MSLNDSNKVKRVSFSHIPSPLQVAVTAVAMSFDKETQQAADKALTRGQYSESLYVKA